ncbi:MAG: hypothetical protein IT292_11110 [Deltaproteobacteria bacterium]|nr:hypothetical protein [Deltaproteobacteria bacterium]
MFREDIALFTVYDDHVSYDTAEGERSLMRAILKSAMDDMNRSGLLRRQAIEFFNHFDDNYLYSFISICRHLDLCPYTIRYLVGLGVRHPFAQQLTERKLKIAA